MTDQLLSGSIAGALVAALYAMIKIITWLMKRNSISSDSPTPTQTIAQNIEMMQQISTYIIEDKIQQEYLRRDVQGIKSGQDVLNARIGELVASQQRLVDHMSELVTRMDRAFENLPRG